MKYILHSAQNLNSKLEHKKIHVSYLYKYKVHVTIILKIKFKTSKYKLNNMWFEILNFIFVCNII